MRVAVLPYQGIKRECYAQIIGAAMDLAKEPRMQEMARWEWPRFSQWLLSHPFELDKGNAKRKDSATACDPPQRMRRFPDTMNCWERAFHTLAWFAARGAARATLYDHDSLVGRHIEVLVPPETYLGASKTLPARGPANGAAEQAIAGVLGGLQGGLTGASAGAAAGPYGALAGFLIGAGVGAAKGALTTDQPAPSAPTPPKQPESVPTPAKPVTPAEILPALQPVISQQQKSESPPPSLAPALKAAVGVKRARKAPKKNEKTKKKGKKS